VLDDLDGRIDAVLDAGPTRQGVESTVLDPCQSPMVIYRPGAVTAEQIGAVAGAVEVFRAAEALSESPREGLPSPGVGLRHYAPKARLVLIDLPGASIPALSQGLAIEALRYPGARVGLMLPTEISSLGRNAVVHPWGRWSAPEELARELYAGLRALDARDCTVILCPVPPAEGIGAAIRDRLVKAAQRE
jgi:L-threonylcarbamoyladenylate synthase